MYHCRLPEPGRKPGGVEVFVDRVASALTRRGHDVTVLTYSGAEVPRPYRTVALRPERVGGSRVLRQYVAPWRFNGRALEGYDVFHFHGDDWFARRRPVPTVRTFYGSALLEALSATSLKRKADQSLIFALELLAARTADARYGIGIDSRTIYAADGVLQCGIDLPQAGLTPSEHPTIAFIGTWEGRKRGRMLHDAFQEHVRPRLPDAELLMVSDRCEPGPGVMWVREPSDEELDEVLRRAWVFCLPSSYEGLGLPYLEAMAWGVPVVATPNPGAEDLLRGGLSGLIVEADDLGPSLTGLLEDPERRAQLSAAGRERAADFAWDHIVDEYERAYGHAIERFRARA